MAGWTNTRVLAVETQGADSFAKAMEAGTPVEIPDITSLAVTLGARRVCDEVVQLSGQHNVQSLVVSDAAAVSACAQFLDDQRVLVEPSCGAALSVVYDQHPALTDIDGPILVIVCGGAGVTRCRPM